MSDNPEVTSRYGHHGRTGGSTSPGGRLVPTATTASSVAQNTARDSAMQFNSDVGRHTTTTFSRDTLQIEDNSVEDSQFRAEQSHLNLNINVTQNIPHYDQTTGSVLHPRTNPALAEIHRARLSDQERPIETSGSRSGGDMSDTQLSNSLPTPLSANSCAPPGPLSKSLTEEDQHVVEAIQKRISDIFNMYQILSRKFTRFKRLPKLSLDSMRKDLDAQSKMLLVTIENGELISCIKSTLETARLLPLSSSVPSFPLTFQQDTVIENIQRRLDHIHKQLGQVDDLSDYVAVEQDRINLPLRLRKGFGKANQGGHQPSSSAIIGGGGVTKKLRRPRMSRKTQGNNNLQDLSGIISMLSTRIEEFQKQCQRLQPPLHDTTLEDISIPEDLELTKAVAVMLFKALCQVCPNKNHVHNVLFGLSSEELPCNQKGDTGVKFNLAFECPGESETWFTVQSTLKGQEDEEMEVELVNATVRSSPNPRLSFSQHLREFPYVTGEPNARFCLQYYKQGTNDLAVALKHSDVCEHEVFYPKQDRLDIIRDNGQAIPLRQLLEEDCHQMQQLEMLPKVRLARMLAEAVLKFHSADWLSCKWDLDNILIYEIEGHLEPHLRFELCSPRSAPADSPEQLPETAPRSQQMSHVLSQLGVLLWYIAVGSHPGPANYENVQDVSGSSMYAEIFQTCLDMSRNENSLGDQEMQNRFYAKVVAKLDELEDYLIKEWQA